MCLLAVFYRVVEDAPVVVGANREEYYARGGEPPQVLDGGRAVAGIDPVGGGTWLGLNADGVLVAVTNRRKSRLPAQPRSRGLLARDLLRCPTAADAAEQAARELERDAYAGCNVFCADSETAVVLHAGDWLRVRTLPPGIHVLANRDVNDPTDARVQHSLRWLERHKYGCSQQCLMALEELCAQTGGAGPAICFRHEDRGTVSSSLIAVRQPLSASIYLHAQGPPDTTPYRDVSHLLHDLVS